MAAPATPTPTPSYSADFKDLAVCILAGDRTAALDVLEDMVPADFTQVSEDLQAAIRAEDTDAAEEILREEYPDLVKMCVCVPMSTATKT